MNQLEGLLLNCSRPTFIIFPFWDPHFLERIQGCQNWTTKRKKRYNIFRTRHASMHDAVSFPGFPTGNETVNNQQIASPWKCKPRCYAKSPTVQGVHWHDWEMGNVQPCYQASPIFCSLVCVQYNTQKWESSLPLPCIILNANQRTKKTGEAWEQGWGLYLMQEMQSGGCLYPYVMCIWGESCYSQK